MVQHASGARIAVIGGGIVGAFAAYFLARAGAVPVLIERGEVGGQASGNNPGGLNPLYGPGIPGPLQPFALEAYALHLEHWDDIGANGATFNGRQKQRLNLAVDDADRSRLELMKRNYDATEGFSARWVDHDELAEFDSRLAATVESGLLAVGDARVDPVLYTRAVVDAARRWGATAVAAEARELRTTGRRVVGVDAGSETIACDGVVVATGAWSDGPAGWLDTPLPIEPVKGDLLLVQLEGGGVRTDLAWREAAAYQMPDGNVLLGGTEDHVGFDSAPSEHARRSILERVSAVMPAVASARLIEQTAGLRPLAPDGFPIVGPVDGWDNACVALGGGRKGMLFASAMGKAAADLLTTGGTDVSIAPCTPSRFRAATHTEGRTE